MLATELYRRHFFRFHENTSATMSFNGSLANSTTNSTSVYAFNVIVLFRHHLLALSIVLLNGLVIISILRYRHLQTRSNWFICQLSISDLLMGMVLHLKELLFFSWYPQLTLSKRCIGMMAVFQVLCLQSETMLMVVTVDRYIAVIYPLRYYALMKPLRVKIIITATWIWSVTMSVIMLCKNRSAQYPQSCNYFELTEAHVQYIVRGYFLVLMSVMLIAYVKIFAAARHAKQINYSSQQSATFLQNVKQAKVMFLIIGSFVVCYTPINVLSILTAYTGYKLSNVVDFITFIMLYMNSLTNPLIYSWRNKRLRQAIHHMLCCKPRNSISIE